MNLILSLIANSLVFERFPIKYKVVLLNNARIINLDSAFGTGTGGVPGVCCFIFYPKTYE